MTRERAIEVLKAWNLNWSDEFTANEFEQAFAMAIKALEQEPIFDKIRAEIAEYEEEVFHRTEDYSDYAIVRHCLDITNKYIAESENKECI